MDLVPIKKQKIKRENNIIEAFIVPAIALKQTNGNLKKIPHPNGKDSLIFSDLNTAIETITIAGFGYSFEEKKFLAEEIPKSTIPDLTQPVFPLLELLTDDNAEVIASAAYALGELRSHLAIKPLIDILGVDDPNIRRNATEALAKIGDESLNSLLRALESNNWVTRNSAAIAIGELTNYESFKIIQAIPALTKALQDSNWIVRSSAAKSIGKISAYSRKYLKK